MKFIADLHIHSRFSRACSRDLNPENLWKWGQLKGISVIGTGDFTHPQWLAEIREKLEPATNGLYRLREEFRIAGVPPACAADPLFMPTAEISCIYRKNDRTRKVHALVLAPDFAAVDRINTALDKIGNLKSDGRPILGLDARELLRIVLENSPEALFIPAHAWTPHFSVFGAASGFNSLEECFEDLTPHIHAIETGLSSDPPMNWRLSALDNIRLISNSDAHSPAKLGREATIFDTDCSWQGISSAIRTGKGFIGTIEFFPEEGKYHTDGHRGCGVRLSPAETIANNGLCPACGKHVTIGVLHRVEKLADRPEGNRPATEHLFHSIIPLPEIIGQVLNVGPASKKVNNLYLSLLEKIGNEFTILLDTPLSAIEQASSPRMAEAVQRMRQGDFRIEAGYDGEFGRISIFDQS